MKEKRMNLSKSQAKERTLDTYPHSGMLIRDILEQLISGEYLELNDEKVCLLRLHKSGIVHLRSVGYVSGHRELTLVLVGREFHPLTIKIQRIALATEISLDGK